MADTLRDDEQRELLMRLDEAYEQRATAEATQRLELLAMHLGNPGAIGVLLEHVDGALGEQRSCGCSFPVLARSED